MFHAIGYINDRWAVLIATQGRERELSLGSGGVRCRIVTAADKELIMRISRYMLREL